MIIVTGTVLARPDNFEEILRLATEHVVRSRTEQGCLSHAAHRDTEHPLRLHFFERWMDMAALKVNFRVPSSQSFGAALARLAAEAPSMTVYAAEEMRRG